MSPQIAPEGQRAVFTAGTRTKASSVRSAIATNGSLR